MSARLIDQAIGETLARINGEDGYTHKLNGTGQIVSERRSRPPEGARERPSAAYWVASVVEGPAALPAWQSTGVWVVTVWTAPSPTKATQRRQWTLELLDDVRRALRSNPRLRTGGQDQVATMTIEIQPWDVESQSEGAAAHGVLVVSLTVTWRER